MQNDDLLERDLSSAATAETDALDWDALRQLSLRPGGFRDERVVLWPRLLNVHTPSPSPDSAPHLPIDPSAAPGRDPPNLYAHLLDEGVESHPDERQVRLDTDRSFVLYPVEDVTAHEKKQQALHDLIVSVFRRRRRLSYFQGYHDIVSVMFLTLPQELQLLCVEQLSLHRVRDAMGASLEPVVGLLRVLTRVLALADPEYAAKLDDHQPLPYYALSNLLTLFSHDVPTLPLIQHVFDYLLCRPPIATVYLAVAVILTRKQEVDKLEEEGEDGMIHSLLSSLPDLHDDYSDEPEKIPGADDGRAQSIVSEDLDTTESMENVVLGTLDVPATASLYSSTNAESGLVPSVEVQRGEDDGPDDAIDAFNGEQGANITHTDVDQASDVSEPTSQTEQTALLDSSTVQEKTSSPQARSRSPSPVRIRRPRVSLSSLLERSDELFALYPPSHPAIALSSIMGPQSVVFTWSERRSELPDDDEAELMVTQPQLVVLPPPPVELESKEGMDDEKPHKRPHRRLHKPRRLVVERKTVVASAVLVLGVAMAIYGLQATPERHHGSASRELRRLSRMFGGLMLGAGERIWDGIAGMTG